VRQTAAERRETVLAAAIEEFGTRGFHGTPTEAIAKRAGISHAYLFRLFATKKELFLACVDRCFDRTIEMFRVAAAAPEPGETTRGAMGRAYIDMLADRSLVLLQLQSYAATDDEEIRARVRERYEGLRGEIASLLGDEVAALEFIGQGMLLNNVAAMQLDPEGWVWLGASGT
jgi:AcrR family transcriptional regulator